jgi:hypothetical protein
MRRKDLFKVSYTIKDRNLLLSEKSATFSFMQEAFVFMRKVMNENIVGKPMIERI